jgi:hypothetical protein
MSNNRSRDQSLGEALGMNVSPLVIVEHPLIVGDNRVGIEIELENLPRLQGYGQPDLSYWDSVPDGSLRNSGREFITKGDGVGGLLLYKATIEIEAFLESHNPDPNWRCSTHVHVDVRDMTLLELKKFILAYVFYEKFIFRESGWNRYKNNFCVPMGVAQTQIETVSDAFSHRITSIRSFSNYINDRWGKYTALNLKNMVRLGTFEFRMPQSTFKSNDLIKVSNRFLSLKKLSKEHEGESLTDFIDSMYNLDVTQVFSKCLGRSSTFLIPDKEFGLHLAMDILMIRSLKVKTNQIYDELANRHAEENEEEDYEGDEDPDFYDEDGNEMYHD